VGSSGVNALPCTGAGASGDACAAVAGAARAGTALAAPSSRFTAPPPPGWAPASGGGAACGAGGASQGPPPFARRMRPLWPKPAALCAWNSKPSTSVPAREDIPRAVRRKRGAEHPRKRGSQRARRLRTEACARERTAHAQAAMYRAPGRYACAERWSGAEEERAGGQTDGFLGLGLCLQAQPTARSAAQSKDARALATAGTPQNHSPTRGRHRLSARVCSRAHARLRRLNRSSCRQRTRRAAQTGASPARGQLVGTAGVCFI
jgi:hypothetical protein